MFILVEIEQKLMDKKEIEGIPVEIKVVETLNN